MPTVNVYLNFNGNCKSAFEFYKSIFGGEFEFVGHYKDISDEARENFPFCNDDHIMHITLPISKETMLMGCDRIHQDSENDNTKNNFALIVHADHKEETLRIFEALAEDGEIIVPIENQFWGSYYGLCIDKFGISWKITCNTI